MVCDLAWFYRGGMSHDYLLNLPITELSDIKKSADKLQARLQR